MKVLKALLVGLVAIIGWMSGVYAIAAQPMAPQEVCRSMTFDSDKKECLRIIRQGYFHPLATGVCYEMTFDSDKKACLKIIANKEFVSEDVKICEEMTFDSDIKECLQSVGRPHRPEPTPVCPSYRSISSSTSLALRSLRRGEYLRAERIIEELNYDLRRCR